VTPDPTGHDALAYGLAWLHPAWMTLGLALALLALRPALRLRRARQAGARREPGLLRRHLRLARPAVVLLLAGFAGGPASAFWLRGWTPFERAHGWIGAAAFVLFAAAGALGWRLQRGRDRRPGARELHGWLGLAAVLAAAVASVAGFVLLP